MFRCACQRDKTKQSDRNSHVFIWPSPTLQFLELSLPKCTIFNSSKHKDHNTREETFYFPNGSIIHRRFHLHTRTHTRYIDDFLDIKGIYLCWFENMESITGNTFKKKQKTRRARFVNTHTLRVPWCAANTLTEIFSQQLIHSIAGKGEWVSEHNCSAQTYN